MKRIISLILIFGLFLSVCSFSYAEELNNEPSFTDTLEYGFLDVLDVLPDFFLNEGKITRGEFAYIISRLYFNDMIYSSGLSEDTFSDVPLSYEYLSEILILKNAGIIVGDSLGRFRPSDFITFNEALTILIRVTGYEEYAKANGGYPTGYIYVANNQGALKGVMVDTETLTTYDAVKVIYNSLFMKAITIKSIENGEKQTVAGDEIILESHLGITLYDSLIVNNGTTSLDGSDADEGKIVISDYLNGKKMILNNSYSDLFSYLGVRMNVFVKYNEQKDCNEVIYFRKNSKVTENILAKDNVIAINSDYIEYEKDKTQSKYYKQYLNKDKPYVIINGTVTSVYTDSELVPQNGFATFIDNDGDDRADVISVINFDYAIFTDRISEGMLYCKVNAVNSLDLSEDTEIAYKIFKNNTPVLPEDISINDVVSVAKGGKTGEGKDLYILYVSSQSINGTVETVSEDGITVSGVTYPLSSFFVSSNPAFLSASALGIGGNFRLNVLGEIEFLDKSVNTNINYSYLINIGKEQGSDPDTVLKYYSVKGEIVTHKISSKVKIDSNSLDGKLINGSSASSFDEIKELLCIRPDGTVDIPTEAAYSFYNKKFTHINPRPAILKLNSDKEIISIDTDAPTYVSGIEAKDFSSNLVAGVRHPKDESFYGTTYNGGFLINADTICIKVPDVDRYGLLNGKYSTIYMNSFETDIDDINNYGIYTATSYLTSAYDYDMQAYNVDPDTGYAGLVVVRGATLKDGVATASGLGVFLKLVSCYDSIREKNAYKLYWYQSGEVKSTLVDTDYLHVWYKNLLFGGKHEKTILNPGTSSELAFYEDVEPLKEGDIIGVETTGSYLSMIGRDLNMSKIYDKIPSTARPSGMQGAYLYTSYNENGTTIPFDEFNLKKKGYEDSANFELSVALGVTGTILKTRVMYDNTTTVSTIRDYLEADGNINYFDRFLNVAATVPVTHIYETSCNVANDGCKFRAEAGTLNDIKPALSGSADDINKASKLYIYHSRGTVREIVIINLLEAHSNH